MELIKPGRLKPGDTVALVSLSSGMAGEDAFRHIYLLGKKRLETVFGLRVKVMPHALKGADYVYNHPGTRAEDMMAAFADPGVQGVISMIGGDDTIRLLPYIDFAMLRQNPKVFLGYSDSTINHFMLLKAGVTSFYGPSVLSGFGENAAMHDYTVNHLRQTLFEGTAPQQIAPSPAWTSEYLDWADEANDHIPRKMVEESRGYELLQGTGKARGHLLGGCVDVFPMLLGTPLWPGLDHWRGAVLFLETSEECPEPAALCYILRSMAAGGIIGVINGIVMAKPKDEKYYEEYKQVLKKVVGVETGRPNLPVLYNLNFGHTMPMCTLPYGVQAEVDCVAKSFCLLESGVR